MHALFALFLTLPVLAEEKAPENAENASSEDATAATTGTLAVELGEGQAGRIFLDGADTGVDAPGLLSDVPPGDHLLQVKGNCLSGATSVSVVAGDNPTKKLDLNPLGGFVQIAVTPDSATLRIDSEPVSGAAGGLNLACGTYEISAEANGFVPRTEVLDVEMGQAYSLSFDLPDESTVGSIHIMVDPEADHILVDGAVVGQGLEAIAPYMPVGLHTVGADRIGYTDSQQDVQVAAGEIAEVQLTLAAMSTARNRWSPRKRRLVAGSATSTVGAAMILGGFVSYGIAASAVSDAQDFWNTHPEDGEGAQQMREENAVPPWRAAWALWSVGGLAVGGGGALILLDDGAGIGLSTTW